MNTDFGKYPGLTVKIPGQILVANQPDAELLHE
jgi:hypothetical protein